MKLLVKPLTLHNPEVLYVVITAGEKPSVVGAYRNQSVAKAVAYAAGGFLSPVVIDEVDPLIAETLENLTIKESGIDNTKCWSDEEWAVYFTTNPVLIRPNRRNKGFPTKIKKLIKVNCIKNPWNLAEMPFSLFSDTPYFGKYLRVTLWVQSRLVLSDNKKPTRQEILHFGWTDPRIHPPLTFRERCERFKNDPSILARPSDKIRLLYNDLSVKNGTAGVEIGNQVECDRQIIGWQWL